MRDSEAMVQYLFELDSKCPPKYGWRVVSSEAFGTQIASIVAKADQIRDGVRSIEELNSVYWHDMARNIEAYDITALWRATELKKSIIRSLNAREILPPAILSRSLLELAARLIVNSNTVWKTIKDWPPAVRGELILCPELEEFVVRIIWGTRFGEPPKHLRQKGVGDDIKFLSKNPSAHELENVYHYLCEIAHPNVIGNARFWARIEARSEDGSETLSIEPNAEFSTTGEIREKTLWALGWSAACVRNGFEIGQGAVQEILKRWPKPRGQQ